MSSFTIATIKIWALLLATMIHGQYPPEVPSTHPCTAYSLLNGAGFVPHDTDCDKFIQCSYRPDGSFQRQVRHCAFPSFWDSGTLTCTLASKSDCTTDKCNGQANGTLFKSGNNCRGYWRCMAGKSVASCCPYGYHFNDINGGCNFSGYYLCSDTCFDDFYDSKKYDNFKSDNRAGSFKRRLKLERRITRPEFKPEPEIRDLIPDTKNRHSAVMEKDRTQKGIPEIRTEIKPYTTGWKANLKHVEITDQKHSGDIATEPGIDTIPGLEPEPGAEPQLEASPKGVSEYFPCDKQPVEGNPYKYKVKAAGFITVTMPCAIGTIYSSEMCSCIHDVSIDPAERMQCKRELHLTFDRDVSDVSGKNNYVLNKNVTVGNGVAKFNGIDSRLIIPRFNNMDVIKTLYIRIRYTSSYNNTGDVKFVSALVSNSDCTNVPSILIAEDIDNTYYGIGTTESNFVYIHIPKRQEQQQYETQTDEQTNEKTLEYLFSEGSIEVSDGFVKKVKPARGEIRNIQCALHIGHAENFGPFQGEINELEIFLCDPKGNKTRFDNDASDVTRHPKLKAV